MANQITGKIEMISATQQLPKKSGEGMFLKRELVLDVTRFDPYTGEKSGYDNFVKLEFCGEKCQELDAYQRGQVVTVSFDLQGVKYQDKNDGSTKFMTSIRGYKIEGRLRKTTYNDGHANGWPVQQAMQYQQPMQQGYQQAPHPYQQPYQQTTPTNDLPW